MQTMESENGIPPRRPRTGNKLAVFLTLLLWIALIGGGLYGGKLYMEQSKEEWTADVNKQTAEQLADIQADYEEQLTAMNEQLHQQIAAVEAKVTTLNELLAFARDNSGSNTDNSNQLYSQLRELKAQLEQLKKNMDVLK